MFLQATWSDSYFDNILFEGNLLEGNGYNLVLERRNGGYGTNIRAVDNRFTVQGFGVGYVEFGPGWAQWQENRLNDSRKPQHRGDLLAEPMTAAAPTLTAPEGLLALADGAGITLSWTDNSDAERGYKIMRSAGGGPFESLTIIGENARTWTDTSPAPNALGCYRVAAVNDDGVSGNSNTTCAAAP